ncbi:leucine-rich repeat-containing protein 27-like isoform X1 [Actinia tenebrosa]|uniref:Leucine-rich repeat-containing protein 27-like isoform X1 n=1 Tax=Actinia tenebrosa TaxID=6105 RepID=A0A6P8HD13_ACTTE|nr:leucine-rich repeat-containing protein 27-like isoform X1 [Actinia tenebrosa]
MSKGKQHHNKMAVGEESGLKRVEQLIKTAIALGNTTIDLGSKNLTEIPSEILDLPQLEFLYLEGNKITAFPEGFFENLPNLKWLDVRNNRISEIPTSVGSHRCLRNLLLEGNEIKELPLELGFAKCLSGLNLTSNPLEMPPSQVLERGTQEVLKFLREKYAEKMGLNGQESFLKEVSQSSSEEDLGYGSRDYQIAIVPDEEKELVKDEGVKVERVKLPPIFQAAAERSRNRTFHENENVLRGLKSKQFEPNTTKNNFQVSEPEVSLKSPKRQRKEIPRGNSPQKELFASLEERKRKDNFSGARSKKHSDSSIRQSLESQKSERKAEHGAKPSVHAKHAKRRKSRGQSPTKNTEQNFKTKDSKPHHLALSHDTQAVNHKPSHRKPDNPFIETQNSSDRDNTIKEITLKTSDMNVDERIAMPQNYQETSKKIHPGEIESAIHAPFSLKLNEGDFIAIQVPDKLYIKGQPCLGKITSTADRLGLLTVHYYTGIYDGCWRPMMSRTSPYLRKVPEASVLCKFKLSSDGRMSPITRNKVRKIIDGE